MEWALGFGEPIGGSEAGAQGSGLGQARMEPGPGQRLWGWRGGAGRSRGQEAGGQGLVTNP